MIAATPISSLNAVDVLRARVGARSDSALARMMGVSAPAVCRWRKRNQVPERATLLPDHCNGLSVAELRKAIALLPEQERRILTLELMTGIVGG